MTKQCAVDGCKRLFSCRNYCAMHYKRWAKYGDPLTLRVSATRSMPFKERWRAQVDASGDCWVWTGTRTSKGYGMITYEGRLRIATRVAWTTQVGPIPDGLLVLHHCDNPPCVRVSHLYLGTHQQNSDDKWSRGRAGGYGVIPRLNAGEGNVHAKLTTVDVLAIRKAAADGIPLEVLAGKYGVIKRSIWNIVRRRTWRHV